MAVLSTVALIAAGAVAFAAGCYGPELRDCVVSCAGVEECAGGQVCGSDGLCAAPEIAGTCGDRDAGGIFVDAALVDAALVDAALVDAGLHDGSPHPDASVDPIDASIDDPDAAAGPVSLHVVVDGMGRVRDDAHGILCTNDCIYDFPSGTQLTLVAQTTNAAWDFQGWTAGPCTDGPSSCVLVLSAATDVTASFDNNP